MYEGGLKHINYEALQQETPYQSIFEAEMKLIKKGYSGGLLQLFQLKDHLYFEICQGEECWNIFWNLKEQTGFKYNSCLPGIRIFPGKVQTVYENYIVRSISALDLKTNISESIILRIVESMRLAGKCWKMIILFCCFIM